MNWLAPILPGGNLTRIAVYALTAAIALLAAFGYGVVWQSDRQEKRQQEQQTVITKYVTQVVEKQGAVTVKTVTKYIHDTQTIQGAEDAIHQAIPQLVAPAADASCPVPVGFVRGWNLSNAGTVPGAATRDDGRPSGVVLSAIEDEHNAESALHRRKEAQLDACKSWIREQYKAMNGVELGY